jgi:hypothetical protein
MRSKVTWALSAPAAQISSNTRRNMIVGLLFPTDTPDKGDCLDDGVSVH